MVLSYISYASAIFNLTWATRSPFAALVLFFWVHVPLTWGVFGTGSVSVREFAVFYPAVATLAALLGFLYACRLNNAALVTWLWRPCQDPSGYRCQWLHVVKHFFFQLALMTSSVVYELWSPSSRWVGGLVSLLLAALVWTLYWVCARRDTTLSQSAVARRTFFVWTAFFDIILIRLPSTLTSMLWADFTFGLWPLYVMLASLAFALFPALLFVEIVFLRATASVCCPAAPAVAACPAPVCRQRDAYTPKNDQGYAVPLLDV